MRGFVAPDDMLVASGAPSELALEILLEMVLTEPLADKLALACAQRRVAPAALIADVLTVVIRDDLFVAVLDA